MIEVHHQDGTGDVTVTTRDKHTVDDSDMVCAWNVTADGRERLVKVPRERVVRIVVLDSDEQTLTERDTA